MTLSIHNFAELAAFAVQFNKVSATTAAASEESKTLIGPAIVNAAEFNRRALIALNGVSFGRGSRAAELVSSVRFRISQQQAITREQQQALYNICHRYRRQITDRSVQSYAAMRARGADA